MIDKSETGGLVKGVSLGDRLSTELQGQKKRR